MKSSTSKKRRAQREAQWLTLWDACESGRRLAEIDKVPCPSLTVHQLESTLQEMQKHGDASRIEIIKCSLEADQEIAKYCQQHDSSYCYGKDSDFLIFADCPYIEFGELIRHGVVLVAERVWYRA